MRARRVVSVVEVVAKQLVSLVVSDVKEGFQRKLSVAVGDARVPE